MAQRIEEYVGLEEGWAVLSAAISRLEDFLVLGKVPEDCSNGKKVQIFGKKEYSEMYTIVYNMCTQAKPHNWAARLYSRYSERLLDFIKKDIVSNLPTASGPELLEKLNESWKIYVVYTKWMERFFTYLDRYHVKSNAELTLKARGKFLFNHHVIQAISARLIPTYLDLVASDRSGTPVNDELMRDIVQILLALGTETFEVYNQQLEHQLIPSSYEYYQNVSNQWLESLSFSEYIYKTERALIEERERCDRYLLGHKLTSNLPATSLRLETVVIKALLQNPMKKLLEKSTAIGFLLQQNDRKALKRVCELFCKLEDGLQPVAASFKNYVVERVSEVYDEKMKSINSKCTEVDINNRPIISEKTLLEAARDPKFVEAMVAIHEDLKSFIQQCFSKSNLFPKALQEAFAIVINQDTGRTTFAALLAHYCDKTFKLSYNASLEDDEIAQMFDRITDLFTFLSDKDYFLESYRNLLSRRLLMETSANHQVEKSFVSKLKLKCGAAMTSRLEGMLNDLLPCAMKSKEFDAFCITEASVGSQKEVTKSEAQEKLFGGIDFSAQILQYGHWPAGPDFVSVPAPISLCLEKFKEFYLKATASRKIRWVNHLGTAVLSREFKTKHEIGCSIPQACLLLQFNETKDPLKFEELMASLNMDKVVLKRTLGTLMMGKYALVKSASASNNKVSATGSFVVNEEFSSQYRRLKLPVPLVSSEQTSVKEQVEVDRSDAIRAAIVRVMKARQERSLDQLRNEVITLLKEFKPSIEAFKVQLEWCIEKEHLVRDEEDNKIFRYRA